MKGAIGRAWWSLWFMDDDDKTPQGKLGRGYFYIICKAFFFLLIAGGVIPTVIWIVGETVEHFTP